MENKKVALLSFTILFVTMIAMINIPTLNQNLSVVIGDEIKHISYLHYCKGLSSYFECDSLSKTNSKGTQTRCYIYSNEINRSTYKICKAGWKKA